MIIWKSLSPLIWKYSWMSTSYLLWSRLIPDPSVLPRGNGCPHSQHFSPLWSWRLDTGAVQAEQTTESGQLHVIFQTSISQFSCHKLLAGQKGLLLWHSSTFLTFFYALNCFLTHKSESSKLVLQACLWSSIRKSDVRLSGLGASYPEIFPNCLPHFSRRAQTRKYHQDEGEKSQKCGGEETVKTEGNLN